MSFITHTTSELSGDVLKVNSMSHFYLTGSRIVAFWKKKYPRITYVYLENQTKHNMITNDKQTELTFQYMDKSD